MMKVLLINGSPHEKGCTYTALREVAGALGSQGVETELIWLGNKPMQDCISCHRCDELGKCVFDGDGINDILGAASTADGFVFGSPVYFSHPTGRILSAMDRLFYSCRSSGRECFAHKPAAAVVSARRAGTTASFDVLNKYFASSEMPIVTSNYWNVIHGNTPEEVLKDEEGLQILRNLGRNMAWLLKCIECAGSSGVSLPKNEHDKRTNFIR